MPPVTIWLRDDEHARALQAARDEGLLKHDGSPNLSELVRRALKFSDDRSIDERLSNVEERLARIETLAEEANR